jgi:hypothetical protein
MILNVEDFFDFLVRVLCVFRVILSMILFDNVDSSGQSQKSQKS